jgi:NDP-sugar pyrophosphorylase family protein
MKALILAGGEGVRLRPLTYSIPKPLLPIKEKPILEIIIERLASFGIKEIILATGYKSYMIEAYFIDGSRHGVKIDYIVEKKRMGTAASLKSLNGLIIDPILVLNGDVITDLDFNVLYEFHKSSGSELTVCVVRYKVKIPYGVVRYDNLNSFIGLDEKPIKKFMVNAGVYIVDPTLIRLIPEDVVFDMTDLIASAKKLNKKITVFEITDRWIDIGLVENYNQINKYGF